MATLMEGKKPQDGMNLALAVALFVSPWVMGFAGEFMAAWNAWVGPRHPKVAAAGMWAMAGFRAYLVVHNLRNTQKALPRNP